MPEAKAKVYRECAMCGLGFVRIDQHGHLVDDESEWPLHAICDRVASGELDTEEVVLAAESDYYDADDWRELLYMDPDVFTCAAMEVADRYDRVTQLHELNDSPLEQIRRDWSERDGAEH